MRGKWDWRMRAEKLRTFYFSVDRWREHWCLARSASAPIIKVNHTVASSSASLVDWLRFSIQFSQPLFQAMLRAFLPEGTGGFANLECACEAELIQQLWNPITGRPIHV
jgi:hypothetical protein